MKPIVEKLVKILSKVPVLFVVIAAFALGYSFRGVVLDNSASLEGAGGRAAAQADQPSEATAWTCSMHPQIRLPEPGQCPICGMDLVPAGKPEAPKKSKAKYACAMFCVPPMEEPGQCPICGMDMVAIEEDEDDGADDGQQGPRLRLSAKAQKLAEIRVAPVERKFVTADIHMVGKVDYDETRLGYLTAWVPGRLDRLYVDYTGVPVKKGDHMVYLYSPDLLTAQVELIEALNAVRQLEGSNVPSMRQTATDTVEAVREKLRLWGLTPAQVEQIESRGTPSDHMTIFAPMGGIVIHKNAVEGMYVKTGTRIYTIADLSHVWVKLDAYESDLAWIRYGQDLTFETEAYPGETFSGSIAFIDPVLDAKTRTVKVRVNVDNSDGRLKPQMFVRAVVFSQIAAGGRVMDAQLAGKWICPMHHEVIEGGPGSCNLCGMPLVEAESIYVSIDPTKAEAPLVIPASAPLITGRRAVVYVAVQDRQRTYEGREIVLGPRAGDYYLVRQGLSEGELVVVNGNFKIDSAIQIRAKPSMMSPEGGEPAPGHQHHGAGGEGGN